MLAPADLSLVARDSVLEEEEEEAGAAEEAVEGGRCGLWPAECLEVTVVHSPSLLMLDKVESDERVGVKKEDQQRSKVNLTRIKCGLCLHQDGGNSGHCTALLSSTHLHSLDTSKVNRYGIL